MQHRGRAQLTIPQAEHHGFAHAGASLIFVKFLWPVPGGRAM